jgi:hypothetical protein
MYMRMDIDKIFNLFDGSSLENKAEEASDTIIIQETPMFWIGMFKKIILNNKAFYQHLYNSLDPEVVKEMVVWIIWLIWLRTQEHGFISLN